ncbi:toxin glutamine deamidase domain-containing protein [Micromonospora sp. NBC_00858]|uniref:toxin glutamine deamidase domain-containing protein n=1 Tax=Micromonospora sp. NBC_00858 TaxID=2975979 RepID=UPI003868FCCD|nr:toxin glutamine deamidase domain-containing protein [Micromonospora sp. NBC_00858]
MSVLPSPIPHPLDYAPWDVPGWIYEALDLVVGVQWPEGNERAVWDLADQWYSVAAVLAGPHTDAAAAAAEVRSGYGGVGSVDAAFEAAWRGIAEGDDAPLPVLLAVTADLGRLVEECGCDIEGAKLEVWIELGILVVELLALAVAAVLTAGAASPAAGAAITVTRLLIQQIFKRLMGQLASKSLRHGLKEAGERAAKEVARGGARGLAKRATRGGLEEAAEEAGISLAIQAYQNSTGRAHGVDLTDLGASAVGGLAGGAVAPLAGLGRHATGRAARVGEHLGREMTGEVLAESAASLATGQGLTSVEDAVRAAASGATGSATGQADHALQARLDAQANALAGASLAGPSISSVGSSPVTSSGMASPAVVPGIPAQASAVAGADVIASPVSPDHAAPLRGELPTYSGSGLPHGAEPPQPTSLDVNGSSSLAVVGVSEVDDSPSGSSLDGVPSSGRPGDGTRVPSTEWSAASQAVAANPTLSSAVADPTLSSVAAPVAGPLDPATGPAAGVAAGNPVSAPHATAPNAVAPTVTAPGLPVTTPSTVAPNVTALAPPATSTGPAPSVVTTPGAAAGSAWGGTATGSSVRPSVGRAGLPSRFATRQALAPPDHPARGRASVPADVAALDDSPLPDIESSDWYAARWTAEAEAAERRRYQGYYESRRSEFENSRRQAEAGRLRALAAEHDRRAAEYANYARQLRQTGHPRWADGWQRTANDEMRAYAECRDLADAVLAGTTAPPVVDIGDVAFRQANKDMGALALGAVETAGRSRLTGDDVPPPIDDSRPYGQPGGLRPPLALHQVDVERQMPREPDGTIVRTADPRRGGWFRLLNDGGPEADATRGINCLDCTLSLFETWVHGRPRVSAPRTFDGYLDGDIRRPIRGEAGGPGRVEDATGGRFQQLLAPPSGQRSHPAQARRAADRGYANLHDQLLLGGHGSYAFLVTDWPNGGSHAWVALNQNGTVLYVDPQTGLVRDRPLYPHVVGIDALVLDGSGRPMPLGGLPRGRFSERPDLPDHPPTLDDGGHGDPYINRMYLLLDGPGSAEPPAGVSDGADSSNLEQLTLDLARLTTSEWTALTDLRDRASAAADRVEDALSQVGQSVTKTMNLREPVQLRDREFRVKGLESLARKYLDEARGVNIGVEEFAETVNDVLRFLFEMPSGERYRDAVHLMLAGLVEAGFSVPNSDLKNFWRAGNRFYGFNCTVRSPDGLLLELQLHTRGSREVWMQTHGDYEILRRVSSSPEEHVCALLRMLAANREHRMPERVPPGLEEHFPTKDASFARWLSRNGDAWQKYRSWLDRQGSNFSEVVRQLGLKSGDFPVSEELAPKLEKDFVDVLRDLPE